MKASKEKLFFRQLTESAHKRVVCVDATKIIKGVYPGGKVLRGQVYHVTGIHETDKGFGIQILGKPIKCYDGEGSWRPDRFRVIA